ncbi:translation elongation factor Ts [Paraclostridium bifermentans]|jgi:elongation factor Ts|uniref:Elongation factor Ts n=1 Tax=Paraclostridium bifermentans ATCC 638 = DSM 14991 TaxID=1233171 RepID=T4VIH4_PARBF|nr:translation elongation factor Ts [Paraclostridium bifermentans]RDC50133.1 elongation factor Ts [Acinetobacter sp. RIT592]EQK43514.1 translation elongation factor Ts [[Clostridium] bifermentans ATCC 638] [Paraclostridium bifermentans ATCC 638 = DSM 14991]MBS5953159.1 elongation factor Ts [Paraclostridium bifermentans]MBU5287328.1 translation elongation factor Ts [Paraclostridium bifermentans]MDU3336182.1 translation elongation factor Ts [Paraclostridium bifermentans]
MAITAQMVKELRETTGAGMMDCKKALQEAEGNMERAIDLLREKGLSKAAKKSDRIAAEGLVAIEMNADNTVGAIVEINSETDFVAKNEDFKTFVKDVAEMALATEKEDVAGLLAESHKEGALSEVLNNRIATIGEKLDIRRFEKVSTNGQVAGYIHGGGKIGVLVELETEARDADVLAMGKDIAMQVAAMNPKYVSKDDVDQDYIAHETEILTQQALNEGKPANIVEKMIKGRLEKQLKEVCLVEQAFVKNPDLTIKQLVADVAKKVGSEIKVARVVRFEVGEGIEKKEENFAEEVAKQLK